MSVVGPVLVLRRRIVEVLGGQNERGQEDAVSCASETTGEWLKFCLQTSKVDQSRHESRDLNIG